MIREVQPSLFGGGYCRICDLNYEYTDMHPKHRGTCKNCGDKIELKIIDLQGREI